MHLSPNTLVSSTKWRRTPSIEKNQLDYGNQFFAGSSPLGMTFHSKSIRWLTGLCGYGEKGCSLGKPTDG
jgi:hypothetical protein